MSNIKIVSQIKDQFYCKTCNRSSNTLYKINSNSYCDKCVSIEDKAKVKIVNHIGEEIK
ncbi:MAG: hypothetical protein ACRC7N_04930 [Clostridium sp.]